MKGFAEHRQVAGEVVRASGHKIKSQLKPGGDPDPLVPIGCGLDNSTIHVQPCAARTVLPNYQIDMKADEVTGLVTGLTWEYQPQPASKRTHPGVYKLKTVLTNWNDETLWRSYTMLTDLESVFRSLKSGLGMRPVYHHKEDRCDRHLFITVPVYQAVRVIRRKLKEHGINESRATLREKPSRLYRITATFKQRDDKTLHICPSHPLRR